MKNFFLFTLILFVGCQDNDPKTQQPVNSAYDSIAADDERITTKNMDSKIEDSSSKTNEQDEKPAGKKTDTYSGNKNNLNDTATEKQLNNNDPKGNTNNGDTKTGVYPGNKGSLDDTAAETHPIGGNKAGSVKDILNDPKNSMTSYPAQKSNLSDTAAEAATLKKKIINRKRH